MEVCGKWLHVNLKVVLGADMPAELAILGLSGMLIMALCIWDTIPHHHHLLAAHLAYVCVSPTAHAVRVCASRWSAALPPSMPVFIW